MLNGTRFMGLLWRIDVGSRSADISMHTSAFYGSSKGYYYHHRARIEQLE